MTFLSNNNFQACNFFYILIKPIVVSNVLYIDMLLESDAIVCRSIQILEVNIIVVKIGAVDRLDTLDVDGVWLYVMAYRFISIITLIASYLFPHIEIILFITLTE